MARSDIIAVYKPKGMTSHDVIDRVRRATGERTVGHAGTLDPLAEGVLVVGIGRAATKRLSQEVAKEKEYEAQVRLGITSTTDDEEGEKRQMADSEWLIAHKPKKEDIEGACKKFIGTIEQIPPVYSALKVAGKAAYSYARAGKDVSLLPRRVHIKSIDILSYDWPVLSLRAVTGPGVYVRALARDIGKELGTGAYLAGLVRTRVGEYMLKDAVALNEL